MRLVLHPVVVVCRRLIVTALPLGATCVSVRSVWRGGNVSITSDMMDALMYGGLVVLMDALMDGLMDVDALMGGLMDALMDVMLMDVMMGSLMDALMYAGRRQTGHPCRQLWQMHARGRHQRVAPTEFQGQA